MRSTLLLLVVACSLTAIGCGSDSSSDTLSSADLKSKASEICKTVVTDQQAAVASKDYAKLNAVGEKAIKELQALKPSDADKAKFEAYVTAQTAAQKASEPVADALAAGDTAKAQQLAQDAQAITKSANTAAAAAGLPECGDGSQ